MLAKLVGVPNRIENKLRDSERTVFARPSRFYIVDPDPRWFARRNLYSNRFTLAVWKMGRPSRRLPNCEPATNRLRKRPAGPVSRFRKVKKIAGQISHARTIVSQLARIWKTRDILSYTYKSEDCIFLIFFKPAHQEFLFYFAHHSEI